MTKKSIQIKLENGLEARPIALLVQEASKYDSVIYIECDHKRINAKSIMGMMALGLQILFPAFFYFMENFDPMK